MRRCLTHLITAAAVSFSVPALAQGKSIAPLGAGSARKRMFRPCHRRHRSTRPRSPRRSHRRHPHSAPSASAASRAATTTSTAPRRGWPVGPPPSGGRLPARTAGTASGPGHHRFTGVGLRLWSARPSASAAATTPLATATLSALAAGVGLESTGRGSDHRSQSRIPAPTRGSVASG